MLRDLIRTPPPARPRKVLEAKEPPVRPPMPAFSEGVRGRGVIQMRGEWRDIVRDERGNIIDDTGWRHNQVQNTNAHLLAALCKNQAGYSGYLYFAFGTGLPAWDSAAPAQPYSDTTLTTEVFRKAIPIPSITFRHPITGANIDPTLSNVIQIDTTLALGEANGSALREFGVFSGDATAVADSGLMTDWIVHSRIDKNGSISIDRSIRFTFEVQ